MAKTVGERYAERFVFHPGDQERTRAGVADLIDLAVVHDRARQVNFRRALQNFVFAERQWRKDHADCRTSESLQFVAAFHDRALAAAEEALVQDEQE